ncbi:Uma2 family endonuclease [Sorangium sp. So ce1335]|uniref:Uma2 family endonuclease n=1 Tax=Sorangium sp. So ce1335 TaxID=3133335 RepID=UPI003F5E7A34
MGQPARRTGLSPAEYLAFERASEQKHEYANGEIFAMSGCSREHSLLAGNIQRELGNALLERACEVHTSDMRVKIASTGRYVYPDASVVCGEPVFEDAEVDTLMNPSVVVEVLSETSEAYDRGDKFAQYRSVPSIVEYVLVSQKEARIEHFQRQPDGRWLLSILGPGTQLELESIGVVIDVDRVYRKVPLAPAANEWAERR